MRVKYFSDTDTALVEFTDHEVEETKEISESIYVDLDREGNLVSMTALMLDSLCFRIRKSQPR